MSDATPVMELLEAHPAPVASRLPLVPYDLQLMAGECALIEARDVAQASEFADLCCGLLPLQHGCVRFLGRDWAEAPAEYASALRGRIGRVFRSGAWISFLGTDINILLSQLHHTRRPEPVLRELATELSRRFGLPGLPLVRPDAMAMADLARAACVRAFLGEPLLVLLESPLQGQFADLVPPLLDAVVAAQDRGAAVIWLAHSDIIWSDRSFPATVRLRLMERGLARLRKQP